MVPASVADHVERHQGDHRLFWEGKLQSLCASCHSSEKQRMESTGGPQALDADGWPQGDGAH